MIYHSLKTRLFSVIVKRVETFKGTLVISVTGYPLSARSHSRRQSVARDPRKVTNRMIKNGMRTTRRLHDAQHDRVIQQHRL